MITPDVESCFGLTMAELGLTAIDFADDAQIEALIQGTIFECTGLVPLVSVTAEDAKANLDRSLNANMFRKNASKTPDLVMSSAMDLQVDLVAAREQDQRGQGQQAGDRASGVSGCHHRCWRRADPGE